MTSSFQTRLDSLLCKMLFLWVCLMFPHQEVHFAFLIRGPQSCSFSMHIIRKYVMGSYDWSCYLWSTWSLTARYQVCDHSALLQLDWIPFLLYIKILPWGMVVVEITVCEFWMKETWLSTHFAFHYFISGNQIMVLIIFSMLTKFGLSLASVPPLPHLCTTLQANRTLLSTVHPSLGVKQCRSYLP
jgi:hypothetical protein